MNEELVKAATELKAAADALLELATKPTADPPQLVREYLESEEATKLINRWQSLHHEKQLEEMKKSLLKELGEKIEEEVQARVHDTSGWDNLDPEEVGEAVSRIQYFPDNDDIQSAVDKMDAYPDAGQIENVVDDFDDVQEKANKIEDIAEALAPLVQAVDKLKPMLKAVG